MNAAIVAFTRNGALLARKLAESLGGQAFAPAKYCEEGLTPLSESIGQWAEHWFTKARALVFVSACGIAVRAIAPLVRDKTTDPAVVVLDEKGSYIIPLLSGHIGGANRLAQAIAKSTGGQAVITTATDLNQVTAVDVWAKEHNCVIENREVVKWVSGAALDGQKVGVAVTEMVLDPPFPITLWLRPRVLVLGLGCKRGLSAETLLTAIKEFLWRCGVSPLALTAVATIDLKADEAGLIECCQVMNVPLVTYTAEELGKVAGRFSSSQWVLETTGVDNVCERAAVKASSGRLVCGKTVFPGITLALAKGEMKD